jgi:excisionase family DNA binding protein
MTERVLDPDSLTEEERRSLRDQLQKLRSAGGSDSGENRVRLEGEEGGVVELPAGVAEALLGALGDLAEGSAVSIAGAEEELTTREAADLLNVSRPHLTKLLKKGEIPSHKVGSHHRVYRRDVLAYRARRRKESEVAMHKLTEESQKLGLGY